MLRLTNLKLPLDHSEQDLKSAILKKLRLSVDALTSYTVLKRSYDARKRGAIALVYAIDIETPREPQLLKRFKKDSHVKPMDFLESSKIATATRLVVAVSDGYAL